MIDVTGTQIYWFISVGLVVGFLVGIFINGEGVSLMANLFWGVVGGLIMGYIGVQLGLGDGVWFSFIANWPFLFLINVFHQHHVEDIKGEVDHPAHLVRGGKKGTGSAA